MTKIYLISFVDKNGKTWSKQVFTNKRKAQNYQRYWNAVMKNKTDIYIGDKVEIETIPINNFDYKEAAIEEEMKVLPY